MKKINCEGHGIAFSKHDEECNHCKAAEDCQSMTLAKLKKPKQQPKQEGGTSMAKKLTEKKLAALLKKASTAKSIKAIVAENKIEVKLVKGMTIDDAKDAVMKAAFPPVEEDDFDDDDFGDDAGDDVGSDDEDFADDDGDADADADADADSDLDEDANEDNPDEDANEDNPDEGGGTAGVDADDEEINTLTARVTELEKRLDDLTSGKVPLQVSKSNKKAEKDAKRQALLDGMPYDKKALEEMKTANLRMLGAALGHKTFGIPGEKIIPLILKDKKNKPAKPAKPAKK